MPTYDNAPSASLVSDDASATVRYTSDGSEPAAGNACPVSTLGYVIAPIPPQTIQLPCAPVVVLQTAPSLPQLSLRSVTLRHAFQVY